MRFQDWDGSDQDWDGGSRTGNEVARTGDEVATLLMATTPAFSTLPPPGFHGFHFPWEEASPELSRHSGISWIPSPLGFPGIFQGHRAEAGDPSHRQSLGGAQGG